MSLYRQAQTDLFRRTARAMDMLSTCQAGIKQFEALCNELRNLDHQFTPYICADFGLIHYTINTTPEAAGEIMLTLCAMGCSEVECMDVDVTGSKLYTIESDSAPRFTLAVAPTFRAVSHADA
jgi:hypothetical protein